MEIVFLGTGCMVPTKERNHQSIFFFHDGTGILVDCGEATQRQFKLASLKINSVNKIFLTHWHGDHVLGLPGLLQTLSASEYEGPLEIYGPKGTKEKIMLLKKAFEFSVAFPLKIVELSKNEEVFLFPDLSVEAKKLEHSMPCYGYSIKEKDKRRIKLSKVKKLGVPEGPLLGKLQDNTEITWKGKKISPKDTTYLVKGKKVSVVLDTVPCTNANRLAENSDLLISEAVYTSDLLNKAKEYMHLTARQAGELASESNTKKLVLTHFSQRYKTTDDLVKEAKLFFPNTVASYDLMKIKI